MLVIGPGQEISQGYLFNFLLYEGILVCSHQNHLIEAILMSTHNIPFSISKQKITLNHPKSAAMGFFQGTQE